MKNKYEFTISELVYYLYFAIMLTVKGFGFYQGQWPYDVAIMVSFALIVVKLFISDHTIAEWLIIIMLTILGGLIYLNSKEIGIFILIFTVIGMKGVSVKRVMTIGTVIWCVTFSLSALLALLGLRSDIFRGQSKLGLGYIIRWSLGQPHPNVLQISFMILCAFILYTTQLKGKKLWIATVAMLLGNIYIFIYSISYTGIVLAVFYLILNLYLTEKSDKRLNMLEKIIITLIMPLSLLFSILGPMLFKGRLWEICNKLLNTRFNIAMEYMRYSPASLFGNGYCEFLPPEMNNLDCSYVFALMHYGIIFFILFFLGYFALIIHCIKNEKRSELAIIIAMCVAGISEPFFVNSSFKNITLIFLGEFIFIIFGKFNNMKKISLINVNRTVKLPLNKLISIWEDYKVAFSTNWKKALITGAVTGMIAGGLFAIFKQMPDGYYALRDSVQVKMDAMYLDMNDLPENFNYVILQYIDNKTPMFKFYGKAVTLEYVRGIISMTLWCGIIMTALSGIYFYKYRSSKNKE